MATEYYDYGKILLWNSLVPCLHPQLGRSAGPLFVKQRDVLPEDVKYRSLSIGYYKDHIVLNFKRHLDSPAAHVHVRSTE